MKNSNDKIHVTRHVSFTPEEDALVQRKAKEAGMSACAFVRQQTLCGQVKGVDGELLKKHIEAIEFVAERIMVYTSDKNPNPWLFAADLELIRSELAELKEMESKLIQMISGA